MIPTYWILIFAHYTGGKIVMESRPDTYQTIAACTQAGRDAQWDKQRNGIASATLCREVRK